MRRSAAIPPNHYSSPSQTRRAARSVDGNLCRLDHGTPELLAAPDQLAHLVWRAAERLRFQRQDAGLEVGRPKRLADRIRHLPRNLLRRSGWTRDRHPSIGIDAG